jgi:hypothetical protein
MKTLALALLAVTSVLAVRADDEAADKFFALGTECFARNGGLEVHLYGDSLIWLNGARQPTSEDNPYVEMKPGDVIVTGSPMMWADADKPSPLPPGDFYLYRLDSVASAKAFFTLSTYDDNSSQLSPQTHRHSMGRQRWGALRFKVDLPHIIFGLDGPSYLISGGGKTPRSK